LPWGEKLANLDSSGSIWLDIHLLARFLSLGYIIFAVIWQFRSGERRQALILGLGMLPFVAGIFYEILGESGIVPFIPFGELGFLGIAIAASLHMSNSVISTEESLDQYRQNLEQMVEVRTKELERANIQLTQEVGSRQIAESALRQAERRARALLDAPPDSAMLVDLDGTILDLNEVAAARLGIDLRDSEGKNVYTLFEDALAEKRRSKAALLIETREPVTWEDERSGRSYENHLYPILDDDGQVASIAIFARDITELKIVQEEEIAAAANQERTRLARDLHDAVTQTIYSASLITEVLPSIWERNPEEGRRNLLMLRQLVRGALAEMRTLLFELRPASMDAAELSTLLHHLGDALTGRTRIPVEYQIVEDGAPPKDIKIAVYRIAQEAINNIAKHSEATRVEVGLQSNSDHLQLTVKDDGRGFDPRQVPDEKLGTKIMSERAHEISASLELDSAAGKGTRISLSWPSEEPAESKTGEG
jgi:PAS domain S-box-containing protein